MRKALAVITAIFTACPLLVQSGELSPSLTVATWNFENLGGEHGESLFPDRSRARKERDFDAFRKYLLATEAEVILLQEVASPKAMRQVLPKRYSYFIAPDYFNAGSIPGIFTGIAYDSTAVKVTGVMTIPTGVEYSAGSGPPVRARDSVAIQLQLGAQRIWVVSVHLKSSCERKMLPTARASTDCIVLHRQLLILRDWLPRLMGDDSHVVLGGDFNRRGDPDYESDAYLSLVRSPVASRVVAKPVQRNCTTFAGADRKPIDYYMLFGIPPDRVSVEELVIADADLQAGYKLSDHCPVLLRISPTLRG
ncbi:MAG: hypothetical protein JWR74_826 [Polaromonas sp.]|nr:hypothetical protein [Polaromonas sp.]